jgi:uncharacterized YigZ family protein
MKPFSFSTISGPTEGFYKDKGSKFISFAYPVKDSAEVKQYIDQLRKKYYDARHHCYAWIIGAARENSRAFDDGEPNHSAGDPILGQIRSRKLTNTLVVVVRYFGGTKLGVSGLVAAYKRAADDALSKATIIEEEIVSTFTLTYDYGFTPEVMKLVKDFDLKVLSQNFEAMCEVELEVKERLKSALMERLHLLNATGTAITILLE